MIRETAPASISLRGTALTAPVSRRSTSAITFRSEDVSEEEMVHREIAIFSGRPSSAPVSWGRSAGDHRRSGTDILILGGSEVGMSTALNLDLQGFQVRLVHRCQLSRIDRPCHDFGFSEVEDRRTKLSSTWKKALIEESRATSVISRSGRGSTANAMPGGLISSA